MTTSTIISFSWLPLLKVFDKSFNDVELKSPLMPRELIEYLEANHNMMIFADAEAKKPVRLLANEFGVEFENAVSGIIEILFLLGLRGSRLQQQE